MSVELIIVAASGLVLLFALWWLYFLQASGPELERHRSLAFLWGYGHYFVFASLAAVGAGIEVVTEAITHEIPAGPLLVAYSLALPVAIYLAVPVVPALADGQPRAVSALAHRRRARAVPLHPAARARPADAGRRRAPGGRGGRADRA